MSTIRSDNNLYTNPKPAQEYERKLVGSDYVDWDSTDEVDDFFAVPPLDPSYKDNKYFWIAGVYMEYTGIEYRVVGAGTTTVDNGLNKDNGPIELGGTLIRNTIIDGTNANGLSLAGLTDFSITMQNGLQTLQLQYLPGVGFISIDNGSYRALLALDYNNAISLVGGPSAGGTIGINIDLVNQITEILGSDVIITNLQNLSNKVLSTDADGKVILVDAAPVDSVQTLSFVVGDDPGPPYDGFDGYIAAGSTAIITQLIGKTLISMVWGGVISQCWVPGAQQFLFDTGTGEVDNTMLGPWSDGDWVIFNYK